MKSYLTSTGLLSVVTGYDSNYYIVDGHHHAYALLMLYNKHGLCDSGSTNCKITAYVHIKHNYENNSFDDSSFWDHMIEKNYFWAYEYVNDYDAYRPYQPSDLPSNIFRMGDDPYRSIMGLARHQAFHSPSGDAVGFYQFKWAACAHDTISPAYNDSTNNSGTIDYSYSISLAV